MEDWSFSSCSFFFRSFGSSRKNGIDIMRNAIVAVLILTSCGGMKENQEEPIKICEKVESLQIDSDSVCLSAYSCSEGQESWFQMHMCFCWDSLCMCFIKESSSLCSNPLDESCGMTGGMLIIDPGVCALDSKARDEMFFPEQDLQKGM